MNKLEILSVEEFKEAHKELMGHRLLMRNINAISHCSANLFGNCVVGTLRIPDMKNHGSLRLRCGFYMDESRLIIIDNDKKASEIFRQMAKEESFEGESPAFMIFELVEYLIRDDTLFLEEYERRLDRIEDIATENMNRLPKDFDGFMSGYRKELRQIAGYYKLLADVTDVMEEAMAKSGQEREGQLFSFLGNKVQRLYSDAMSMNEYVLQIRDIYQSKISSAQNRVIHFLTIVTSIFMPLTLIAGWYGMNFEHMPELGFRYGYFFIAALAAAIVIVEIVVFKLKKWF